MSVEDLFKSPLKVVNVGLESFSQDLRSAGVECQQVSVGPVEPREGQAPGSDGEARRMSTEREVN